MKMKNVFSVRNLSLAVVAGIFALASCSKSDNPLTSNDVQNVNSETVSSSTANEASDLANSVVSNVSDSQLAGARVSGGPVTITGLDGLDGRLSGATITITGTGTKDSPSGTISIDYGSGVTTNKITRKGQIIVAYTGRRLQPGSVRTITFAGFSRNSVAISGSYTVTVTDTTLTSTDLTATFTHVTDLTLTFPDNTTITRTANFTVVWDLIIATPLKSTITHKSGGGATGTTRKGATYTMAITKDLVFRADCLLSGNFVPLSGTKTISVASSSGATPVVYTLDFGTGTACNTSVTVSVNGKSKVITVSSDGN
jgi:hypothetical protein